MMKRWIAALLLALTVLFTAGCSVKQDRRQAETAAPLQTTAGTRIHNNFKDTLPDFKFSGDMSENYQEGLRYTFSVPCSKRTYQKYLEALNKAGYQIAVVSMDSYYSAYNAEDYFVEVAFREKLLTVTVKRTNGVN